jgi:hypothetical protein
VRGAGPVGNRVDESSRVKSGTRGVWGLAAGGEEEAGKEEAGGEEDRNGDTGTVGTVGTVGMVGETRRSPVLHGAADDEDMVGPGEGMRDRRSEKGLPRCIAGCSVARAAGLLDSRIHPPQNNETVVPHKDRGRRSVDEKTRTHSKNQGAGVGGEGKWVGGWWMCAKKQERKAMS